MPETGTRPRTAEQGALIRTACDHRNGSPGLGIEAFAFRRRLDLQSLAGRHPNVGQPRNQRTIILRPTNGAVPFDPDPLGHLASAGAFDAATAAAIAAANAQLPGT
jgi:hypothetical protein